MNAGYIPGRRFRPPFASYGRDCASLQGHDMAAWWTLSAASCGWCSRRNRTRFNSELCFVFNLAFGLAKGEFAPPWSFMAPVVGFETPTGGGYSIPEPRKVARGLAH
jgi:hypothetical protein